MSRVIVGLLVAIGGALVVVWVLGGRGPASGSGGSSVADRLGGSGDAVIETGREQTLFQEIVRAKKVARREAEMIAPLGGGGFMTLGPSRRKGVEKRELEKRERTSRLLREISRVHGVTVEEIEEVYGRGMAEGWPINEERRDR